MSILYYQQSILYTSREGVSKNVVVVKNDEKKLS